MKVAVFNRYWATHGGGERYAGALAQALAAEHDVHLLSPAPVDWPRLEEQLGLDLSRTTARTVPAYPLLSPRITAEYDLLVNCSYMSSEVNGARRGIYVVLFPVQGGDALDAVKRAGARTLGPLLKRDGMSAEWGRGFHPGERSRLRVFRWTTSEAELLVTLPAGMAARVRLTFLAFRPRSAPPSPVLVEVDGTVRAETRVGGDLRPVALDVDVVGRGPEAPITLLVRTEVFVPGEDAAGDSRRLGVPLAAVQIGAGPRAWLLARFPFLDPSRASGNWLDTYQDVVSISEFTRLWVRRRWKRDSRVIHPPVPIESGGGPKAPLILSVGRFFDQRFGHSKKQLELVRAFRALRAAGLSGWELHLVGGCQQQHARYLAEVRAEAEGLPVVFHIDAPGRELRGLYHRASVYWHGAGLGERERSHPERLEHFGISTVEAMGAGAVPIVVGKAGQREIVQHGVNGYHFSSLDDLVARTLEVARDPKLRQRIADAARQRADDFSEKRFAARVCALVEAPPSR
jgi:glycosyltransferase involved in cell wall biosynthesis